MKSRTLLLSVFVLTFIHFSRIFGQNFYQVDTVIDNAIKRHVFPGATVIIGGPDKILYNKAYGHFTYDPESRQVTTESLFDMASCTKVFATTSCIMKLVDEGKVNIEDPVKKYLPEFAQNGKENVKIKNLLLHNSGLQAYYTPKAGETPEQIFETIYGLPLSYKTDSDMVYSCLNFVTTMKVVEAVTKMPMYKYFKENFTEPLEMKRTMFIPSDEFKSECLPTTDSLQGIVHDPLARGLKGLSGNAGLFSTTADLAKICQILLNDGLYNGKRYYSSDIIKKFTARYSSLSSRALGWDTKSESGFSSAGKLFSANSFGHTGYTGTCVWMDPQRKLFVVFLTNRVYPDDKANVSPARAAVNEAVIRSIEGL
ncbi:MAG: serine hydrolase domain-containing protein [Bacteroidota bacterium]|nr:serine hydrolase domain-containing protein [Bacteroidota bacterium]MDP4190763.1 serine hydrolase domain-containing protein [Bacteroidota bacterium]MDP4194655.1 serine hydrolase domain-containing protein [Bacteroidota bacterium]